MALRVAGVLSVFVLIYVLAPLTITSDTQTSYPISLLVHNPYTSPVNLTYTTEIVYRGILLGAMRKIEKDQKNFTFTIKEDPNYGPFLVSVNGKSGDPAKHTYWELLAKLQNGTVIRPDVGVGCYIPNPYDTVILRFTTWTPEEALRGCNQAGGSSHYQTKSTCWKPI